MRQQEVAHHDISLLKPLKLAFHFLLKRFHFFQILQDTYGLTDELSGDPEETDKKILTKIDWNISDEHRADFTFQYQDNSEDRNTNDEDDEIRMQGFRELGDIVRYTPGVNTSQGEGHRDSIVFRGVRSTADFYLDGVRDDVQYYRSLYNLEQVEILRGPNALLFGRGGTGGIINRVTKKAVLDEQFGSFDMGADSFGAFDFAVDYNVSTGEKSALRINFHSDTLENHRDYYDGDRYGFNPTFRLELSPATTLDLSYEHADHERFIDRGVPTLNGEPVEAFEEIVFGDTDTNLQTLRADIYRANLSHEFSDTRKGNLVVQYSDFQKLYNRWLPAN